MTTADKRTFTDFDDYLTAAYRALIPAAFTFDENGRKLQPADIEAIALAGANDSFGKPPAYLLRTGAMGELLDLGVARKHIFPLMVMTMYAYFHTSRGGLTEQDVLRNAEVSRDHLKRAGFGPTFIDIIEYGLFSMVDDTLDTVPEHPEHLISLFIDFNLSIDLGIRMVGGEVLGKVRVPFWKIPASVDCKALPYEEVHAQYGVPWAKSLLERPQLFRTVEFSHYETYARQSLEHFVLRETP